MGKIGGKVLTLKQRRFAELVAGGMNLTNAYIEAGYNSASYNGAKSSASHLAKMPEVQAAIAAARKTIEIQTAVQSAVAMSRCGTCMAWDVATTTCRRHAPALAGWPKVEEDDWCCEHVQRPAVKD